MTARGSSNSCVRVEIALVLLTSYKDGRKGCGKEAKKGGMAMEDGGRRKAEGGRWKEEGGSANVTHLAPDDNSNDPLQRWLK